MNAITTLMMRNLRVYFKDLGAVSLSMIGSAVLLILYIGFLGSLQVNSLAENMPHAKRSDIEWFVSTWVFAGILLITSVTTGLAGHGMFVSDRVNGQYRDFVVSPVKNWQLVTGYLLSSAAISFVMTIAVLAIGQLILWAQGNALMSGWQLLTIVGVIAFGCLAFSCISSLLVTLVRTNGAFAALNAVVSTLVGFFAAAYLPLGLLPDAAIKVINLLPFSQAAMLLRGPLTHDSVLTLTGAQADAIESLNTYYGMTSLTVGDFLIGPWIAVGLIAAFGVIFAFVSSWRIASVLRSAKR